MKSKKYQKPIPFRRLGSLAALTLTLSGSALAAEKTIPVSGTSRMPASVETSEGVQIELGAYFDAYYAWNFNRPAPLTAPAATSVSTAAIPSAQNQTRYYDSYNKQLGLNLAEITVKAKRRDVSLLVDLDFGQAADMTAAYSNGGTGVDEVSKHIGQAVLTWTPSALPGLTLDLGKMSTHIGLEVIKARDNWNYSRSVLFGYGMPFWHVGARLGYSLVPEKLTVSAYLYNGWNTLYDVNTRPTLGAQLRWIPLSSVTVVYAWIGGPEAASNNHSMKTVHDLNATWAVSDSFSVGFDALTGSDEAGSVGGVTRKVRWQGGEVLAKWQATAWYYLSPRWEIVKDLDGGLFGRTQTMHSYTLTNGFRLGEGLETRVELRRDHSNYGNYFNTRRGVNTTGKQDTASLAFLASF